MTTEPSDAELARMLRKLAGEMAEGITESRVRLAAERLERGQGAIAGKLPKIPRPVVTWYPIEWAPKDGTQILIYLGNTMTPVVASWSQRSTSVGQFGEYAWRPCWATDGHYYNPTRWTPLPSLEIKDRQPLPSPPSATRESTVLDAFGNWIQHREGCRELMQKQMWENLPPTCSCGLDAMLAKFAREAGIEK